MGHWKHFFLVIISIAVLAVLGSAFTCQAAGVNHEEYIRLLCDRLGLGKNLTCGQGIVVLESVGIVPDGGWHCKHPVTCELVAEIQILVINSSQMGLLRYSPEDTVVIVSALSDELHVCPPPKIVEIMPLRTTPSPPIIPDVKGGGIDTRDPLPNPSS